MIRNMFADLGSFLAFILVVLLGFGVAYQGVSTPFASFDSRSVINVLYRYVGILAFLLHCVLLLSAVLCRHWQRFSCFACRPYFQILGEKYLSEFNDESTCVGPWEFSSCGSTTGWLLPVFVAVYVLITNILLLNLLIAMFNSTVRGFFSSLFDCRAHLRSCVCIAVHSNPGTVAAGMGHPELRCAF
jgi:hypothetical protein